MTAAPEPVKVVVVGGGTAGWMTAGALGWVLPEAASVHLVESQEIGIIGPQGPERAQEQAH